MKHGNKLKKIVITVSIFWGIVLAVGGVINGNQSIMAPDYEKLQQTVMNEKLSSSSLDCWISHNRSDFNILEFVKTNQCSTQFAGIKGYSCYNEGVLKNAKWIRNNFQDKDRQLIVFASTDQKSLFAASTLKHYGYKVRMLDRGNEETVTSASEQPGTQTVAAPVVQPAAAANTSQKAARVEEGC